MSNIIYYKDIEQNNYSFSAKMYETHDFKYEKSKKLNDFIILPLQKGVEVGSDAYISNKKFKFIRTSNILDKSNLVDEKSCIGIPEIYFVKDGNLGNVAFLDKDLENCMISSGINILTCKHPYYVYAILQHELFKKNFEYSVTTGSTISHAKDIYLDFDIPLPKNNTENSISFVESLMKSIIQKERLIEEKIINLNQYISKLLNFNGFDNIKNNYATYKDLINIKRLDAGYYSNNAIYIRELIESYQNGYIFIPSKNIKGGNTPKVRSESITTSLKYKWITPSSIDDNGMNSNICSIDFNGKNNINTDTTLIINRTSKKLDGLSGKYVGIASFYDFSFFEEGHHNQGFYRLENYDKTDLITIVVLLNHPIYREYFGEISIGSKMKEIKKYNLTEIPFPKFSDEIKNKINKLYYNEIKWNYNSNTENFKSYDKNWSKDAGIYDLYLILIQQKEFLNKIVESIYNNENIIPKYSF